MEHACIWWCCPEQRRVNVLTRASASSCADREACWSEPSGQGRALVRSGGLQQQRSPPPLSGTGLLPHRLSSHGVHPGLQSLRKRAFLWHLQAIPSPKHHVWAETLCILPSASLRTASREQGGQTFAPTSLCSPKSSCALWESATERNDWVSPARALRQLLLPKAAAKDHTTALNRPLTLLLEMRLAYLPAQMRDSVERGAVNDCTPRLAIQKMKEACQQLRTTWSWPNQWRSFLQTLRFVALRKVSSHYVVSSLSYQRTHKGAF